MTICLTIVLWTIISKKISITFQNYVVVSLLSYIIKSNKDFWLLSTYSIMCIICIMKFKHTIDEYSDQQPFFTTTTFPTKQIVILFLSQSNSFSVIFLSSVTFEKDIFIVDTNLLLFLYNVTKFGKISDKLQKISKQN